ncbi:MAG: hypothetical protein KatS3mg011_0399 [Acidimicrobiia bacterium]|nr:MAG: hypothetical protein KatS3mg011_0399 [Acidimicrobiia bacterium]
MTTSPSDTATPTPDPLADYAAQVAEAVGGEVVPAKATVKVKVPTDRWVEALTIARDELGLVFFSWLSAVDWSNQVEVGDPPEEEVEERIELLCTVADISDGRRVTFSTDLDHDQPVVDSLIDVYPGADWHERETWEMFGVDFVGHPNLVHLYLPERFIGNPLRKSFPLLSREVKPWPGKVDVEGMPEEEEQESPTTENPGR